MKIDDLVLDEGDSKTNVGNWSVYNGSWYDIIVDGNSEVVSMFFSDENTCVSYFWPEREKNNPSFGVLLEEPKDAIQKFNAIAKGEDYDKRIILNLELDKDIIYYLAMQAHEKDITLNEYIIELINDYIISHDIDVEGTE